MMRPPEIVPPLWAGPLPPDAPKHTDSIDWGRSLPTYA